MQTITVPDRTTGTHASAAVGAREVGGTCVVLDVVAQKARGSCDVVSYGDGPCGAAIASSGGGVRGVAMGGRCFCGDWRGFSSMKRERLRFLCGQTSCV